MLLLESKKKRRKRKRDFAGPMEKEDFVVLDCGKKIAVRESAEVLGFVEDSCGGKGKRRKVVATRKMRRVDAGPVRKKRKKTAAWESPRGQTSTGKERGKV